MSKSKMYIEISELNEALSSFKNEKNNLEALVQRLEKDFEEYKLAELSGRTNDEIILTYEAFTKKCHMRLTSLNNLIKVLEKAYNDYSVAYSEIDKSVGE